MRAGGCTLQQALTPDAAALVKQSVSLARRRGHAQVTPLHVASTMLSSSVGLLRTACMKSHSHPLQCKALELCFNVALNRLPASTTATNPMLGHSHHRHHHSHHHHHHPPTLSNALVAAFKRAQAHQRRGTIETQQQPLLGVKIEIEQLCISILDDPSVSRVMREAGFSSTQVKSNVEQAISLDTPPPPPPPPSSTKQKEASGGLHSIHPTITPADVNVEPRREDVMSVVECLIGRKKRSCVVVVGECLSTAEGVVRGMMETEVFKTVQFINLPLFSFAHLTKDEVDQKVGELRCVLKSCCVGRGAILYLGDLKWAAEYRASCRDNSSRSFYCPVEHVIMELGRMVCGGVGDHHQFSHSTGTRFWFMGVATYQTYMKCRVGYPSLESLWSLHPHTVPAGILGLSLGHDHRNEEKTNQHLPPWLQRLKEADHQNSGVSCSSTSSGGQSMEMDYQQHYHHQYDPKFKELNAENLKTLCCSLETKVPWQMEIIPEIASIVLRCRSGMMRKKDTIGGRRKEDTWMLFQGCDAEGKKKISTELASLVFGSSDLCFFSSCSSGSEEATCLQRFTEAVGQNPHRVFFMDDVERLDYRSLVGIKRAIKRGSISTSSHEHKQDDDNYSHNDDDEEEEEEEEEGEEQQVRLEDAIVILGCKRWDFSRKKPDRYRKETKIMISSCLPLDLNLAACCDDNDDNEDNDDDDVQSTNIDDVGLIQSVDRSFFFKARD